MNDPNEQARRATILAEVGALMQRFQPILSGVPPLPVTDPRYVAAIERAEEEARRQRTTGSGEVDRAAVIKAGYQSQVTYVFARLGLEGDQRWEERNHRQALMCLPGMQDAFGPCGKAPSDGWHLTLKALMPQDIKRRSGELVYEILTDMQVTTRFTHVWVMAPEEVLRALLLRFYPGMAKDDLDVLFEGVEHAPRVVFALRDGLWVEDETEI